MLGREIDEDDLIREIEHRVGNRLPHLRAGDLIDGVGARFEVLDVDRGENVDARVEQFQHVLVALRVARAGRVGVREFIHHDERRMPERERIEIHFLEHCALVLELRAGQNGEPFEQRLRLLAPVRFDHADDHLHALLRLLLRGLQHCVGLAHAGAHAEENLQPPAPRRITFLLDGSEERVGIGAVGFVGHNFI